MTDLPQDYIRCIKCEGRLLPSGVEVHRYECSSCGQQYHAVLRFVPVEPIRRPTLLLESDPAKDMGLDDARGGQAPGRGNEVP